MQFLSKYIAGKHDESTIKYHHPLLELSLKDTYGCMTYQEQVMQIVRDLAGFNYARSDLMRRAMSKKVPKIIAAERNNFIHGCDGVPGCIANGVPEDIANIIFDEIMDFAGYAFPKAHAVAYAFIGYQTAWLKVHYKAEFMAALMTSVIDWTSKIAEYIGECKKIGIKILPPDINESIGRFSVEGENIRFGLKAVKNVGSPFIRAVVKERERNGKFNSMGEFINRMDNRDMNKRCVEYLVKAGAFDSLGGRRSQYNMIYEKIMDSVTNERKKNAAGQLSLFETTESPNMEKQNSNNDTLPNIPEFAQSKLLTDEKEALGVYISGHPVSEYEKQLANLISHTAADFLYDSAVAETGSVSPTVQDGAFVTVGGIIAGKTVKFTKTGEPMAFASLEDMHSTVEAVIFPKIYSKHESHLLEGKAVIIKGRAQSKEEQDSVVVCNELIPLTPDSKPHSSEGVAQSDGVVTPLTNTKKLWLKIPVSDNPPYDKVMAAISRKPGHTPVVLYDERKKERKLVNEELWTEADESVILELKQILGDKSVVVK